jgi:hypothetical protein
MKYNLGGQIKKTEMGVGEHVASVGTEERRIQGFGGESEGKRRLGRPKRADGRIILKFIFKKYDRGGWGKWLGTSSGPFLTR